MTQTTNNAIVLDKASLTHKLTSNKIRGTKEATKVQIDPKASAPRHSLERATSPGPTFEKVPLKNSLCGPLGSRLGKVRNLISK